MATTRRDFLRSVFGASTVVSLSPAMPLVLARAALAADPKDAADTVLVVLQLSGGNDGLNTVVPYADDAYGRRRKSLRLTAGEVHKIDALLGFHPQMPSFLRLLGDQQLSVIQGVGYPQSNRSHDDALRDWHTAQPGEASCQTGWLGRAIDRAALSGRMENPGVLVAPIPRPFALNAERSVVPSVHDPRQLTLTARRKSAGDAQLLETVRSATADSGNPLLSRVRNSTLAAHLHSQKIEAVLQAADPSAVYPAFALAKDLQTVAELIHAGVGIRIFFTELGGSGIGGFDNHANQRDNHAALLRELSESVAAFVGDLKRRKLLDRVVLMTFSEFGRTLSENGRRGTDHGAAAPVLLAGGRLNGGLVGRHPSLTDLDGDAPKFQTDFRSVYATLLQRWLGFDAQAILGQTYETLDLFA